MADGDKQDKEVLGSAKLVFNTLTGDRINLELVEKGDLPMIKQWVNDVEFIGEFEPFDKVSAEVLERQHDGKGEGQWYFVEKKDGTEIG